MLPLQLLARKLYRRAEEGGRNPKSNSTPTVSVDTPLTETPTASLDNIFPQDKVGKEDSQYLTADGSSGDLTPQHSSINQSGPTNGHIADTQGDNALTVEA